MNINTELVEKIKKAKEERQIPTPEDKPYISLVNWFAYIKLTPRVADQKEAEDYKLRLKSKGLE